jgi:hypothetical protein
VADLLDVARGQMSAFDRGDVEAFRAIVAAGTKARSQTSRPGEWRIWGAMDPQILHSLPKQRLAAPTQPPSSPPLAGPDGRSAAHGVG